MLNAKVTVLIPIGPNKIYREYLPDAIQSVLNQTVMPSEILIIDDGANITDQELYDMIGDIRQWRMSKHDVNHWVIGSSNLGLPTLSVWQSPANIGFAQAFNCGVALANNDLIIYLAADDKLEPDAIKDCVEAWETNDQKDAWYALTYQSSDGISDIPINAAMITRNLWNWMRGYPPSAFAGPDALALSRLMVHAPDRIIKVKPGKVNYMIRKHEFQETNYQASFFLEEMGSIRNKETARFKPNLEVILK